MMFIVPFFMVSSIFILDCIIHRLKIINLSKPQAMQGLISIKEEIFSLLQVLI
jgi:hypothetical protein